MSNIKDAGPKFQEWSKDWNEEPWHLTHMNNMPNDANLIQAEGFGVVRDGLHEMACYAPEPEPSLWARLLDWLKSPSFWA